MVLKNLWRRRTRTLLTILGIAIGVAAVVALSAMAQGIIQNYGSVLGASNDLLVVQADAIDPLLSNLDEDLGLRLQAIPGVESVEPGVYTWIVAEDLPFFLLFGYEPGSVAMRHYHIVEGKPVTGARQIAIGRRGADALNKDIDDTLRIYGVPYRIVGIYETGQGLEESGGVVTLSDAQAIAQKPRKVSLFQIGLRPNADLDQVMERITAVSRELSVSRASGYEGGQEWAGMIQGFAWGIAAIAILIGGLGMMNAMVMSVLERTREIGTLRAVGWSRWRVLQMILGEAVILSLIGGVFGIGIGVGLAELVAQIPAFGTLVEGSYSIEIFLQGMITALGLGLIGGLYPAWRAANLQPVEALRYEGGGAGEVGGWASRVASQTFRNLWRRRARTLISITGIGIGVATLVMLGGMTNGLIQQLNSLAGSGSPGNITVMQRDVPDLSLSTLDERLVGQIQAMPQVKSVSPIVLGFVMTPDLPLFIITGLDPNTAAMSHYKLVEGRYVQRPNEVLVGRTAAQNYRLALDSTLVLYNNRYKVVGIYETGLAWEEGGGVMALREAQRLLNRPRSVSFIFVDVTNPAEAETVRAAIDARIPDARASLSSEFAQNTEDIQNWEAISNGISLLALVVGGIVVANTMIMSVYERTREIGTLRALGWKQRRVLLQILQESLLLCLLAGVTGSIMGVVLLNLLAQAPGADAYLLPTWDVPTFAQAIGLALVVGLIGSLYPAWQASRLQPVEALRYE